MLHLFSVLSPSLEFNLDFLVLVESVLEFLHQLFKHLHELILLNCLILQSLNLLGLFVALGSKVLALLGSPSTLTDRTIRIHVQVPHQALQSW